MATTVIWRSSGLKYHQMRCCGSTRRRRSDLTNEFRRRLTSWPSRRRPDRMIPPRHDREHPTDERAEPIRSERLGAHPGAGVKGDREAPL